LVSEGLGRVKGRVYTPDGGRCACRHEYPTRRTRMPEEEEEDEGDDGQREQQDDA
jgi:hypothetical protein